MAVASAFAFGAAEDGAIGRAFFLLRAGVEIRDSGSDRFIPIKRSCGGRLGQAVRGPWAPICAEHQQSHELNSLFWALEVSLVSNVTSKLFTLQLSSYRPHEEL